MLIAIAIIVVLLLILIQQTSNANMRIRNNSKCYSEKFVASSYFGDERSYPAAYDAFPYGPHGINSAELHSPL